MTGNSSIDISLTDVWRSYRRFRKGKKPSLAIIEFEAGLMDNIIGLHKSLDNGSYKHGPYAHMIVSDRKRRDIAVASVRDRVVHRLLYDHLVLIWDKTFIYDAWSCRKEKGLQKAIERAQDLMRRYKSAWVWRADINKLFDSVDQEALKTILRKREKNLRVLKLLDEVIDTYSSFEAKRGIPIGNLTSQIFANIYLNEFDRFMVHELKPLAYMRYGDDWLCFGASKTELESMQERAKEFLNKKLKLCINPKVNITKEVRKGISYLGNELWPNGIIMDKTARNKIYTQLSYRNAGSYRSFINTYNSPKEIERFSWLIIEKIDHS